MMINNLNLIDIQDKERKKRKENSIVNCNLISGIK